MRKAELIDDIKSARADFLQAIEGLSRDELLQLGAVGMWSVKDIMAHLVAWESELITGLNTAQSGRAPRIIDIEDFHTWNEEQYHANAGRSLDAVLADFEGVHRMLLKMVREYNEKALTNRHKYRWMAGEPLTYLIQETASLHEREHAEDIRAWRAEKGI
jgi:hypothetical protein